MDGMLDRQSEDVRPTAQSVPAENGDPFCNRTPEHTTIRVALAHDWLVGMRGGEKVLERLAQTYGPTDLYTMVHKSAIRHADAIEACTIHTGQLQNWPGGSGRLRRWYLPLYPRIVDSIQLPADCFDILISTSSAFIKSLKPPVGRNGKPIPHLCYCHTPARYLWDQQADYAGSSVKSRMRSAGLSASSAWLREYDKRTASRVTHFLANSKHTARRIKRAYGRESTVVHPPVDVGYYDVDSQLDRRDFYLVVSALEPYKRVDLAIEAAKQAGLRLVIAGDGSERDRLRALAAGGRGEIMFVGLKSLQDIRELYQRARALLFPGQEDFGIVPVEAMACGCPIIAYNIGGSEDWMGDGCGITFESQTSDSIQSAIQEFDKGTWDANTIRTNALRFHPERFDEAMRTQVEQVMKAQISR